MLKKIFNFQKKEEIFGTKNLSVAQRIGWFFGRSFRNLTILGLFIATSYISARIYNALHPIMVKADTVTVEVPAEPKLSDYPILVKICKAESGGKQFKDNGNVMRGTIDPSDIGICQIHETLWNDQARKLGYDIYTEKGNEEMAIYIFTNYGTDPWNSSKAVWSKLK